jgi:hypothetical protein
MNALRTWISLAVALAGCCVVVHSLVASFALMPGLPYLDHLLLQAWFFHEVDEGREALFPFELMRGNEHLVLFPMPLFWLDNELFAARGTLLVGITHAINWLCAWWLAGLARRAFALDRAAWLATLAAIAASLAWNVHGQNLCWPYQVHLYVWWLGWIAAARCAEWADRSGSKRALAATLLCATVALYSFGFGIASFAALIAFALLRWPLRRSTVVAAVGAALLALYWFGMARGHLGAGMGDGGWLAHVAAIGGQCLYLLSMPLYFLLCAVLPQAAANVAALALTGAAILFAAFCTARHLRRRQPPEPARTAGALLVTAAVVGAVTTAISRAHLQGEAARADRYAVLAVSFWLGALLFAVALLPRRRDLAVVATAAAVLPLLLAAHFAPMRLLVMRGQREMLVAAEMAVLDGVDDPTALVHLHPDYADPRMLPRVARGLRERQWSLFAGPQDEWLGRRLGELFPAKVAPIRGFVQSAVPVAAGRPGIRVDGYAFDPVHGVAPEWIVLVDPQDVVVGVGHRRRREVAELMGHLPRDLDPSLDPDGFWVGYLQAPVTGELRAFAIVGDGAAALTR